MNRSAHGDLVRHILEAARSRAGNAEKLAAKLQELGITGEHRRPYSQSAVSNWIRGRTMPPADVLLAAAEIADVPLPVPGQLARFQPPREEARHGMDGPAPILARAAAPTESAFGTPEVEALADLRGQIHDLWDAIRQLQDSDARSGGA